MERQKYQSFNGTFRYCTFALAIALIYPNPSRRVKRIKLLVFCLIILSMSFVLLWFTSYLYFCYIARDMFNFTRNMTVGIVVFLFFFKTFYLNYKADEFAVLMDFISDDLLKANDMDEIYQEMFDTYIKKGLVAQKIWIFIPIVQTFIFPVHAALTMFFNILNEDPQPRVMVHEMDILMVRSKQWESPYFEIVWFYTILGGFVLFPNFIGFDGSYCISVNHLCLKLKVLTENLRRAFAETKTNEYLEERVKEVIKEHQSTLVYYNLVQDVFGGWMFVVFFITSLEITFNLYQLSLGGLDPKYIIFCVNTVVHNLIPCYFCTKLIVHGDDFCEALYMTPWEGRYCQSVTKALTFMIARTQSPLYLTGMGMVTFNMELFVSVMQSSYSFFTLIRD